MSNLDTWLWLFMLAPFLTGAIIGGTAAYVVRAERAARDLWAADEREAHWRRELARTRWPQLYPAQHHPYRPSRRGGRPRHRAVPA